MNAARAVLFTRADDVVDAVSATAAALSVAVDIVDDLDALLVRWGDADAVLIGGDVAAVVASAAPRRRPRVHLVGFVADDLARWSMPLGAEVVPLPGGLSWLGDALSVDAASGRLVAVVGGCGGVGASTLAAGLALAAARRGLSAALVDLDPWGGGLDLMLGAERTPGWRWPRLVGARGELSDIRDVLPSVQGVTLVSDARAEGAERVGPEAVAAVVSGLLRHHALVVLDAGRPAGALVAPARRADATLVVAPADVRGVAATTQLLRSLRPQGPTLAVRRRPGAGLAPVLVADAVGIRLAGEVPHDQRLARAAEAGEPPGRRRSPWRRAVGGLLDAVLEDSDGR